jgi:hypothetical protein
MNARALADGPEQALRESLVVNRPANVPRRESNPRV